MISVKSVSYKQGSTKVADPVVTFKGKKLRVTGDLPSNLTRLIPPGWGNAPAEAWKPFVVLAVAMGRL